jgi:two-component system sensor histidine kinase ChvG
MHGRLFDSMVSVRTEQSRDQPHLGLGLYIVRLIAEFHGGRATAMNRADAQGVIVSVDLPLVRAMR